MYLCLYIYVCVCTFIYIYIYIYTRFILPLVPHNPTKLFSDNQHCCNIYIYVYIYLFVYLFSNERNKLENVAG